MAFKLLFVEKVSQDFYYWIIGRVSQRVGRIAAAQMYAFLSSHKSQFRHRTYAKSHILARPPDLPNLSTRAVH
jgi:hypothetical protein